MEAAADKLGRGNRDRVMPNLQAVGGCRLMQFVQSDD
jgi:hypothetical protein